MMAKEAPCMAEITAAAGVAIPGGDDDITLLAGSSASDGGGEKVQTTSPSSSQRPATDTAASPDVQTRQRERNRRKDDPLHKFRVAAQADGPSGSGSGGGAGGGSGGGGGGVKRRSSSFNGRNSRREVLYPKSNQPASVWEARFGRGAASDEDRLLSSTAKKMQARRSPRESSSDLVNNFAIGGRGGDNNPWAGVWGAKEITNCSECSAAQAPSAASASPRQDSSSKFNSSESADAAEERQTLPSVLRRVRSSRSTRRWTTTTETSRATTPEWSGSPAQGGGGHSPTVRFSEDSPQPILRSTPPRSPALDRRRTSAGAEGFVLPSKAKALAALAPATPDASGGTTPEGMSRRCCPEGCNSNSAAASSSSPGPVFREPSSSTGIRECRSCGRGLLLSSESQPQPPNPRSSPLIGSLRHKFSMEATEIRDPTTKPWARSGAKSGKAVMFSNPAYVPSPSGNDGGVGRSDSPTATTTAAAVNSPGAASSPGSRSPSATRRVMNRIGRALSAGRRSISPDLTQRLNSTCHKLISLSPGKNLPSIFPSRAAGRKSSSAPRASFVKSSSCMKAASDISESSEAAPSRRGGSGSGSKSQPLGCSNRDCMMPRTVARDGDVSFAAATHNSSNCDYVITQPSNGEIMQDVFNYGDGAAGGPVPNISTMATPEANLKRSSSSSDTSPEAVREISTRPGRGTSPTDDLVAVRSEAQWEYGSHADVLSSCREWVEKSSPPLPAGLTVVDMNGDSKAVKFPEEEGAREVVELEEDGLRQVVGCSPLSAAAVDETVLGRPAADHATQQQRQEQQRQGQEQQQQQPAANLKKSWSGGSRSSSTGKARQVPGSALLKRAKCWMKTQTPQRERPRQAVEVYAL